jgi:D-alanyl-D-alanine carboxypeptidase
MRRTLPFVMGLCLLVSGCGDTAGSSTSSRAASSVNTTAPTTSTSLPVLPFGEGLQGALDGALGADALGVSLAVMVPGYEPWLGVAGVSEPGVPVTTDMAFGAASAGKNFTAALVLQLAEEGKLSLDDQLQEWLPDYPNIDNTATIRQLLSHTSGAFTLNHYPGFWSAVFADGTRVWTDEELLTTFLAEPYSTPGTEWHYSNTGYTLLGQIIEEATGSTVSTELRDRFFEPLGLTTAFYPPEETARGELAEGWADIGLYAPDVDPGPGLEPFSQFPWTETMPAAGGMFASAEDLATWAQALFHDKTVLTAESLDQMLDWVDVDIAAEEAQLIADYGLGAIRFNPELLDGTLLIGHSGGALFYSALSGYLPDYGVCIGAAQNAETDDAFGLMIEQVVSLITTHVAPAP